MATQQRMQLLTLTLLPLLLLLLLCHASGSADAVRLTATRRLPFASQWCLGIWFYGLGDSGYNVRLDALVEMQASMMRSSGVVQLLTTTAPTNKWHLLMGSLALGGSGGSALSLLTVALETVWHNELRLVLLDDVSITAGACYAYDAERNGTVECGSLEWRCASRLQCVPRWSRCDGRLDCYDGSDEANCHVRDSSDGYWQQLSLRVALGVVLIAGAFALLVACLRIRSARQQRRRQGGGGPQPPPRTVTDGRLPAELRSDRRRWQQHRRPDMPPDYCDVAEGAANAGFAVEEDPPKYDDAVETMRRQQPRGAEGGQLGGGDN